MKYFLVIFAILVAINLNVEAGQFTAIIKTMATTCKNTENASDEDVDNLANLKVPETPQGKCLSACMGHQFGIIQDNKLSKPNLMTKINFVFANDADKKKKAEEVANACLETSDDDRCEAAYKIWKCVEVEAKKRDFELF